MNFTNKFIAVMPSNDRHLKIKDQSVYPACQKEKKSVSFSGNSKSKLIEVIIHIEKISKYFFLHNFFLSNFKIIVFFFNLHEKSKNVDMIVEKSPFLFLLFNPRR